MHNFRNLNIWLKSVELVTEIYRVTENLPKVERFGLIAQLQRAAVSIPANIAEGSAKSSNRDFARFLEIALGSSFELETELLVSKNLNYISEEIYCNFQNNLVELQKMITKFKETLQL
jgi:four helix bundle protein